MKTSFYSKKELINIGFHSFGDNVKISKKASFYSPELMSFGSNVRIDDFCILSGEISLGSYVHISAFCGLYGSKGIEIGDFSGISPNSLIFSAVDDFSGAYLINPMVPSEFTNVSGGRVKLHDFVQLGANTIVMPNIEIREGTITGAFSFVNMDLDSWSKYYGIPVLKKGDRLKNILNLQKKITGE